MNIEAFIIAWNESETIHLTIKHYQKYCSKITIFDNFSDDNTREIAESMGCYVKLFGIQGLLSDQEYIKVKNNCWKESKADFVVVCDADEILDLSFIQDTNATIIKTFGWNVHSTSLPINSWLEQTTGVYDKNYSKSALFSPKLKEIGYIYGCHDCKPIGNVSYSEFTVPLFHYRNAGGSYRLVKRHALYRPRLAPINKKWNLGEHYNHEDERRIREWKERFERSVEFSPGFILQ
jgi:glycosyltransferase involved in cell wall biosynthesis